MPATNPAQKPPTPKGKGPMGIPVWGWIAAVVIGLAIAYVFAKKTGAASQDTGSGSDSNPLGSSDSGTGGGVVAPPPPVYTAPPSGLGSEGGGDQSGLGSTGQDIVDTITDPGNTNPPPSTTATDIWGNPVNLSAADSVFPNAGFATSPYVAPSGNVVTGPGGPVIDLDTATSMIAAPINNPSDFMNSIGPPNILGPGAAIDWQSVETATGGLIGYPGEPATAEQSITPAPYESTVLPHGQVVS